MKRFIRNFLLIILSCFIFLDLDVYASTKTYPRSNEDLRIPDDVVVTEYNRDLIFKTPSVDENEKIYDFANLLTTEEENMLYTNVRAYISQYGLDMAIVTIDDNNKANAQEYAQDFYDYNFFMVDGILFLIDMDTREMYISTSGKAINMYNDYRIDQILDNAYYYISDNEYYSTAESFVNMASDYASIGLPSNDSYNDSYGYDNGTDFVGIFLQCFVFSLFITGIAILILIRMNKMVRKATSSREYLVRETMRINHISETFLGSFITKTKRSNPSGSSGRRGGSSGIRSGSSISIGSSGRSHGGGGRRF